jgi:hypothetical protein
VTKTSTSSRVWTAVLFALAGALYVVFAFVHAALVNTDAGRHDQSTYLWGARALHESHFAVPTNRSQMPAYLYVQALFYLDHATDAAVFARAKAVSIGLSAVLVLALCAFFARALPKTEARIAMLVTAFAVFVFRAAYVQAELLFYTASFFGFVALCRLWERPSLGMAVVAGALEAFAFLCKGSVQPGLALFAGLYLARAAWEARRTRHARWRELASRVAEVGVLVASFLAPIAPYLRKSKELWGSYFYNLNTRYVMWCDSWDDFMAREVALGKSWTWGALPESQLPSMGRYLREHSLGAIAKRELLGVLEVLGNLVLGTGYAEFLALYLVFAAVAFGFTRAPLRALGAIDPRSRVAFALPFALLYLGLFGFYAPIAAGAERGPSATFGTRAVTWSQLNAIVLVLAVLHVLFVVPMTIGRLYAGG